MEKSYEIRKTDIMFVLLITLNISHSSEFHQFDKFLKYLFHKVFLFL